MTKLDIPNHIRLGEKRILLTYLSVFGLVLLLMMILGLMMLLSQSNLINLDDSFFYEIMTMHGTGMIGLAALGGSAILWFFLSQYVSLSRRILITNFIFFLVAVVLILVSVFVFNYAGSWTFLYPLPSISGGAWDAAGATLYLGGMLLLGIGFLLLYADVARAIISEYGGLGKGLGWPHLFGRSDKAPPTTVVAATMVAIVTLTSLIVGAIILVLNLVHVYIPDMALDPLIAKNMTYAFGHIFANATIYMSVIAVYEILPRATNRPWKANKVFLAAWTASTVLTILVFPHHLFMDNVMNTGILMMGQILSHINGLPALLVTAYGALMIIYRSGIRWDLPSSLMILAMFGWLAGGIPAAIDATINVNYIMHNTQWVPGHFHMYMGLGVVGMILGFMYFLRKIDAKSENNKGDWLGFWVYAVFFFGLPATFLFSGNISTPRRWSEHMPEWITPSILGAICAVFIILAVGYFLYRFLRYVLTVGISQDREELDEDVSA